MNRTIRISILFLSVPFFFLTLFSETPSRSSADLKKIQDDFWNHQLEELLYLRLKYGMPVEKLPDISYEGSKRKATFAQSILDRLKKIDLKGLNDEESISYKILEWENSKTIEYHSYFWLTSPVTPYSTWLDTIQRAFVEFSFKETNDLDRYLQLLKEYSSVVRTAHKHLQEQYNQGIFLPKEEIQLVVPYLQSYINDSASNPLVIAEERLESISDKKKIREFNSQIEQILRSELNPAYTSLVSYMTGEYNARATVDVGLARLPNGKSYYRSLVRYRTTMKISPEEIHAIGLKNVEEINKELDKIRQSLNFKGSLSEFRNYLKTDSKFIPKTADEIGNKLMDYVRRIEPLIKSNFTNLPKAQYAVKRLDPSLEGSMAFGYYQTPTSKDPKGYYLFNGSNLQNRTLLWAGSIIYHELIPGHHYQICLQEENTSLPEFRRESSPTAYVEGWAEYASTLAGEMGMYRDDYEKAGNLARKAFQASRLVVDTGMNFYGWPRSRAVQFMKENVLISDADIESETLRYSADIPAQALAYRMGENKFMELREHARAELKERFDIRRFHDAVLGSGAMPMSILEDHIQRYIDNSMKELQ